jgi:hypothetical protein
MKKISLVILALATALATAPAAMADSFNFVVSGPSEAYVSPTHTAGPTFSGSGILTGINEGGGVFDIVTLGSSATFVIGTDTYTAIIIGNPTYPAPSDMLPVSIGATYDDMLTPGTSPYVNDNGLLFSLSGSGSLNGEELEIAYNDYTPGLYYHDDIWNVVNPSTGNPLILNAAGGDPLTEFNLSGATPEPSSLLLMGTGLLLMVGFLFRSKAMQNMI